MPHINDITANRNHVQSEQLKKLEQKLLDISGINQPILNSDSVLNLNHLNNLNKGHRERLKQKFLESGFAGFHDYEIMITEQLEAMGAAVDFFSERSYNIDFNLVNNF